MKKQFVLFVLALGVSLGAFAQKDEIKTATKAIKKGDFAAAKAALEGASGTIDGADSKVQAQYYYLLGDVQAALAKNDAALFDKAASSYNKTISLEEQMGKEKYTTDIQVKLQQMVADLVNGAVDDQKNKAFTDAAKKLYLGYTLSPKDTIYLYYAAGSAVNAPDYDMALEYYSILKELNYDGSTLKYTAVNNETGEREELPKDTRDLYIKAQTHSDPKDERTPSKKAEIVKNVALIYQQQGKNEEALKAYEDAIAQNPKDVNLILNKANLYYGMGDKDKFKELMAEASEMAPDNPDLLYNIGVINMEQGDYEGARGAYKKALAIDPNYTNALLNLSTTYVNEGNDLIDKMNELASSYKKADIAKYDELKEKKDNLFREGASVLETALKTQPENTSILSQLKNIYGALGDAANFKRIKGLLGE
jgi:tetratricopeptide (TPR) repeat protein